MLQTLKIQNVALIDEATLHFDEKLNVISGETGAGKSIMLDSLSFVFGGRADRSLIRTGETKMKVEVIFTNLSEKHIQYIQNTLGISCENEMFLSRELDLNGKNICKINGELVPVVSVKKICQLLVDLHGQSEHLAILNNDYQLQIIDLFNPNIQPILNDLSKEIDQVKLIEKQIAELGGNEKEKQNLIDLYTYQINEIEQAKIADGEYESLVAEKKEMQQYEKINENLKQAYESLSRSSFSTPAIDNVNSAVKNLQNLSNITNSYAELNERLNSALIELNDIAESINYSLHNNVFDEQRYQFVDERIDFIKSLFRKYGGDYVLLTKYLVEARTKLDNLVNGAEKYNILTMQKQEKLEKINKIQNQLTQVRKLTAKNLISKLQLELRELGMPNARVDVEFVKANEEYSYLGADRVEFLFSANLGFELKPLNKVVSGGEMSRVMLAYKIVVSSVDDIQTIIFDEIDSGLSGNIATVVANYLARLSQKKQIIAVSHLPQICAMADCNLKVEKESKNNTTSTKVSGLLGNDLYLEIARLMGAENNEVGLTASKELKEKSNKFKLMLK